MIDEKKLSGLCISDLGTGERSWAIQWLTESDAVELIRLARVGLESEDLERRLREVEKLVQKFAVPAAKLIKDELDSEALKLLNKEPNV